LLLLSLAHDNTMFLKVKYITREETHKLLHIIDRNLYH
jgi:hypothetical protein